jgi:hypothetical protein
VGLCPYLPIRSSLLVEVAAFDDGRVLKATRFEGLAALRLLRDNLDVTLVHTDVALVAV